MLFVGIQQAGPNLTPATYARGMFAWGTHTGEYGRWSFGPNDYTSTDDAREFYYDPRAISPSMSFRSNSTMRAVMVLRMRFNTGRVFMATSRSPSSSGTPS